MVGLSVAFRTLDLFITHNRVRCLNRLRQQLLELRFVQLYGRTIRDVLCLAIVNPLPSARSQRSAQSGVSHVLGINLPMLISLGTSLAAFRNGRYQSSLG